MSSVNFAIADFCLLIGPPQRLECREYGNRLAEQDSIKSLDIYTEMT